jgi:hypothetical protein
MAPKATVPPDPEAAVRMFFIIQVAGPRRPAASRAAAGRRGLIRSACALVLALSLPACHLLDQTDFQPKPVVIPPPPPVPDPETRAALVTIDYARDHPDYANALNTAIHAVETRRPGSLYDVIAVVGDAGGATAGRDRAADVMTAIEAQGVIPARIQLGVKIEPGRRTPQVRVYLR